jgi:hypothetical protein
MKRYDGSEEEGITARTPLTLAEMLRYGPDEICAGLGVSAIIVNAKTGDLRSTTSLDDVCASCNLNVHNSLRFPRICSSAVMIPHYLRRTHRHST